MNAVDAMRVAPSAGKLAESIQNARHGLSPVVRRAAVAAALSSVILAAVLPVPPIGRAAFGVAGAVIALAALVDVHERRLPNRLTAAVAVSGLVAGAAVSLGDGRPVHLLAGLLGGTVAGALMLSVRLGRGVGMGDVKMAAAAGLSVGVLAWWAAPALVAVAALVASLAGFLLRRTTLPLGPALWLGWATTVLLVEVGWSS